MLLVGVRLIRYEQRTQFSITLTSISRDLVSILLVFWLEYYGNLHPILVCCYALAFALCLWREIMFWPDLLLFGHKLSAKCWIFVVKPRSDAIFTMLHTCTPNCLGDVMVPETLNKVVISRTKSTRCSHWKSLFMKTYPAQASLDWIMIRARSEPGEKKRSKWLNTINPSTRCRSSSSPSCCTLN